MNGSKVITNLMKVIKNNTVVEYFCFSESGNLEYTTHLKTGLSPLNTVLDLNLRSRRTVSHGRPYISTFKN